MGQSVEHFRDDFKDVPGEEDLSLPKYQMKFCAEAFFEVSSLKTKFFVVAKIKDFITKFDFFKIPQATTRTPASYYYYY